ncbi:MAG: hypothetical protein QM630_01105 [Microbacterium sp.]
MTAVDNPMPYVEIQRYAGVLRCLLRSLDREIIETALVGESEGNLLDTERQVVNRLRELLNGRILVPLQLDNCRSRGLALLDAFADELEPAVES